MTNTADTSQASEDELEGKILKIIEHNTLEEHVATQLIMNLIRTEKLKLLAEVRGEVIGEDVECDGTCDDGVCGAKQRLIDFQRQQLTKLEAEL